MKYAVKSLYTPDLSTCSIISCIARCGRIAYQKKKKKSQYPLLFPGPEELDFLALYFCSFNISGQICDGYDEPTESAQHTNPSGPWFNTTECIMSCKFSINFYIIDELSCFISV